MRAGDVQRAQELDERLQAFADRNLPLPGIATPAERRSLVRQMIDSLHRIEFVDRLGERAVDPRRLDPSEALFDPIKAAFVHSQGGDIDEAAWLVFLATHFGPSRRHGWELTKRVYGALGLGPWWTWARTSTHLGDFRDWFVAHAPELAGIPLGNHRKYVTMRADAEDNLADTVTSYVAWVGPNRGLRLMLEDAIRTFGSGPGELFDGLYRNMNVVEFGRTGRFDYLTMLGKLRIAAIVPPVPYLNGATGPLRGAKLLFAGHPEAQVKTAALTEWVVHLGHALGVGMQVMEDSLCNWQKSPHKYVPFRG
jgi:hypothetical protein